MDHIESLYNLIKEKSFNISHENLPGFEEHLNFVKNNPYRNWYLVKKSTDIIGSIYLTFENVIGINLNSNICEDYIYTINLIFKLHKPLLPIKSVRSKFFLINANPQNLVLIKALKLLKMDHIQNTYAYKTLS